LLKYGLLLAILVIFAGTHLAAASYQITHIDTQVALNSNTSASVKEVFNLVITNLSVSQYSSDRDALNLTLANWQSIIGPSLTQHIINTKTGVYNFRLLPGPLYTSITGQSAAYIIITYDVNNVTSVTETAPRTFAYSFNRTVFNFQNEQSGQVLTPNTNLTIVLPQGAQITSLYPVPDSPIILASGNYTNSTSLSWYYQEPLSKFTLDYTTHQGLQEEVLSFFTGIYNFFGFFSYMIIAAVVLLFILYTYLKAER